MNAQQIPAMSARLELARDIYLEAKASTEQEWRLVADRMYSALMGGQQKKQPSPECAGYWGQ